MPSPAIGDVTRRQCGMRLGFQVPHCHNSLPVTGSCPLSASPPAINSSLRPWYSKGMGVVNASRDSITAWLGRTTRHMVLPVCGSMASR